MKHSTLLSIYKVLFFLCCVGFGYSAISFMIDFNFWAFIASVSYAVAASCWYYNTKKEEQK